MDQAEEVQQAHRGLRHRLLIVGLTLGYWAGFVLLAIFYAVLRGFTYKVENRPIDVLLVLIGALLSLAMARPLNRLGRLSLPCQISAAALMISCSAVLFETAFRLIMRVAAPGEGFDILEPGSILVGALYWLAPLGLWAAIYLATFHHSETRIRERRLAAVQIEAHEAHVRALRYQVNPHFLYNTLNSVATLILDNRNNRAEEMVLRLAAFFRASLLYDPLRDVTLGDEMSVQMQYLEIERLRFEGSLSVEVDIPADLESALVPSLILQPIIENSVKHGVVEGGELLRVGIVARRSGEQLVLEVRNNGGGNESVSGTGIGLKNVSTRLASRFGDAAGVEAIPLEDEFLTRLTMPYYEA